MTRAPVLALLLVGCYGTAGAGTDTVSYWGGYHDGAADQGRMTDAAIQALGEQHAACQQRITLSVDLSRCNWREVDAGDWRCDWDGGR